MRSPSSLAFVAAAFLATTGAEQALAATHSVSTVGLTFSPRDITITVGDAVQWSIGSNHNVVETDGDGSCTMEPGGFLSGSSEADLSVRSFAHTFPSPGVFYYKCNPHCAGGMRGSVTVEAPADGGPAGDPGMGGGDPGMTGDSANMGDTGMGAGDTAMGGDTTSMGDPGAGGDDAMMGGDSSTMGDPSSMGDAGMGGGDPAMGDDSTSMGDPSSSSGDANDNGDAAAPPTGGSGGSNTDNDSGGCRSSNSGLAGALASLLLLGLTRRRLRHYG